LLPESERTKILNDFSDEELLALEYDWKFWARKNQLEPEGHWQYWLLLAGRGFGKTRTGSEWIREMVESGKSKRIHLIGPTAGDVRDTMVEGESGILSVFSPNKRPLYEPSKRKITFHNGAIALLFSAEEPERLRGPQCDTAWCDELAAWKYPQETWDMFQFGFRSGENPRCVITTTPKPIKLVKDILNDSATSVTRGSTYDNVANLAPAFMNIVIGKYEGTRLGRQELNAEILDDNPDALWNRANIDQNRVTKHPELIKIVVGIDPAVTSKESSDDTGIIVVGIDVIGHCYVLGDYTCHTSPLQWAAESISSYHKHRANYLVAEVNNGGDLVETTIHTVDKFVPVQSVHASRGKQTRAEPVSSLYEQGKVHHVGSFPYLEDEQCDWVPGQGKSPNRIDALVWAVSELTGGCSGDYRGQKATAQKNNVPSMGRNSRKSGLPRM
jgi:phage terminase large subunit-like protein